MILLLSVLFSILDGVRDGFMYNIRNVSLRNVIDEHVIFQVHRAIVLILVIMVDWRVGIFSVLSFPFLHDGSYYTTRELLHTGVYSQYWFSQSYTSTAKMTKFMTPINRTGLFIVAVILFFIL